MPNNYMSLTFETDMSRGISPVTIKAALVYDDNLAHNVRIKCMEKGRFQSMSGTVQAYFIRADNSTVPMNGQIVDGVPEVKLLPECYNIAGRFLFLVKITNSGSTNTIFYGTGNVLRGRTDVVIDPGEVVPSLDELLAKINELELATNASFEATERANSAAETANTAAAAADEVRQDIQSGLAGKAPAIFVTASGDLVHITDGAAMPVKSLITHIEPVQPYQGGTSYMDNVRPISGWTGASLTRTGKNLCPGYKGGAYINSTGMFAPEYNTSYRCTELIRVNDGDYLWVSNGAGAVMEAVHCYDKHKKWLGSYNLNNRIDGTAYIGINFQATTDLGWVQVEKGAPSGAPTAYEPYQGKQFTAPFGQTVYGGTLDWKTGMLTVDGVLTVLTGNEAVTRAGTKQFLLDGIGHSIEKTPYTLPDALCSHFPYDINAFNRPEFSGIVTNDGKVYIRYPAIEADTAESFKAWLAAQYASNAPVTIFIKLETPTEINLTPQQILSLAGENNLWSDAGETEVTYAADTKMYIDQKIAAIAAAVLNN